MTLLGKNLALVFAVLIALTATATAFSTFNTLDGLAFVPIVTAVEFLLYFVALGLANLRTPFPQIIFGTVLLIVVRILTTYIGYGIYIHIIATNDPAFVILFPWTSLGTMIIQVLLLITAGPFFISALFPGILNVEQDGEASQPAANERVQGAHLESAPTGGFIQVFSYEELASVLKKMQGLEGFVLYSNEGLVVWRDLPLRLQTDELIARLQAKAADMAQFVEGNSLTKVRRLIVESREHLLIATTLSGGFGILMLFSDKVPVSEILARVPVGVKSVNEFLLWKYTIPGTAQGSSQSRESIAILPTTS